MIVMDEDNDEDVFHIVTCIPPSLAPNIFLVLKKKGLLVVAANMKMTAVNIEDYFYCPAFTQSRYRVSVILTKANA